MVFVIDKHAGPTSFDVVREVRKITGERKVGHSGSLDPFATGALVVLLGRATKLSGLLLNADKKYRAVAKLGEETDSLDVTGEVVKTLPIPALTPDEIRRTLDSFRGEWLQHAPMFSAKKVHGVRLYELARQQIYVRRPPIPVQIYEIELIQYEAPYLHFEVHCSKGTYVRSLADEIGKRLGTVAHLSELRRLSCGEFRLDEAVTLPRFETEYEAVREEGRRNYLRLLRSEGAFQIGRLPKVGADDRNFVHQKV